MLSLSVECICRHMQEAEPLINKQDQTLPPTGNPEMIVQLNISLFPGMFHIHSCLVIRLWLSSNGWAFIQHYSFQLFFQLYSHFCKLPPGKFQSLLLANMQFCMQTVVRRNVQESLWCHGTAPIDHGSCKLHFIALCASSWAAGRATPQELQGKMTAWWVDKEKPHSRERAGRKTKPWKFSEDSYLKKRSRLRMCRRDKSSEFLKRGRQRLQAHSPQPWQT